MGNRDEKSMREIRKLMPVVTKACFAAAVCCAAAGAQQNTRDPAPAGIDSSQHIADRIVKSPVPVLVDFWAPWCMPCRLLTPIITELKKQYAGRIEVMKINVDIHRSIASYFMVSAVPAVFIVKDRAVVKFIPGVQDKAVYVAAIDEVLTLPAAAQDSSKKNKPTGGNNEGVYTGNPP